MKKLKVTAIAIANGRFISNHRGLTHPAFILQKYDIKWICNSADIRYNRCVEFNKSGFVYEVTYGYKD